MSENTTLIFFVNGRKIEDENIDPEWTLLYYLRKKYLTGTKLGCAEGGCGACTVMISRYDRKNKKPVHYAVNACLMPVCALHGTAVTTVEGIGSVETKLHPVQERIAKSHGSQCGFCTPGFVMSMYTLLRSSSGSPSLKDIEVAFQGNLCRCTGYRPILDGYRTFVDDENESNYYCPMGNDCCRNMNKTATNNSESLKNGVNGNFIEQNGEHANFLFNAQEFEPYDSSQELIFPPELAISDKLDKQSLVIKGPRVSCFRPINLGEIIMLKHKFPNAKIINGNTEVGIEVKFKNCLYPYLIIANMVPELSAMSVEENGVKIGAAATLTDVEKFLKEQVQLRESSDCKIYESIVDILQWFAGKQIRNVAAIGGNIMTGSPISDLNQILMACEAKLELRSLDGTREVVMDDGFWTGYRKNIVKENEVLCSIAIPFSQKNQFFKSYKQARRREDDIAIVNAAFWLDLDGTEVKKIKMAFGGMAPTTALASKTASKLIGKNWDDSLLEEALMSLMDELTLTPSAPGGMVLYRRSLVLSFFFKFYLHVCLELEKLGLARTEKSHRSAIDQFHSLTPSSSQYISKESPFKGKHDTIGLPIIHKSAFKHATGEALYCDDLPSFENEVYLSLVTSTRPHAKIKKIDPSEALKLDGVVGFISAKDIHQERNNFGPIAHDEEILASEKVLCHGQIIGAVAAVDQLIAQRAVNLVKVVYEDLQPVIITTQDAIKHQSFFPDSPFKVKRGDVDEGFRKSYKIVEGELTIGGQEHFYLETHCCVAIPKSEDSEMEIYASSQHPSEIQNLVALALGIPFNRIVCKVKRMGGGFGGKESRSAYLALCTAIAAYKLKRPVRAMLDRKDDMVITGHRHPFYGKYKAGFDRDGKIKACEISLYCNAGCSIDLSDAVMERAMYHVQNAMLIENMEISGYVCRTNLPSNTAFRGFGAPQSMLLGETMVFHIAETLGLDPDLVHYRNFYKDGDYTQYKEKIVNCTIERCWNECKSNSNYEERKVQVSHFNRHGPFLLKIINRFRKRGIALIPTMFGIGFSTPFLNQASALVLIYVDGSVLLSHGGTEMGQGLHTKMIQVASRALGIPTDYIHISETSTDKIPNTSATAASSSSDLNGMAVINACNQINERLKPIRKAKPDISWAELIKEAYFQRISLAATGFYKSPDVGDFSVETGHTFFYYTYGVACSEVEIDCLTGDHQVLRTDIVMDVGQSLNPAIDVGQIEGAFVQGYGLYTLEELVYSPEGMLYSTGPGTYKIPTLSDIPAQFNVSLLKGSSNPRAVYSSKGVGEPPLFLAASIFFAIRDAVKSARKDNNIEGWFTFDSPATSARIRVACVDKIIEKLDQEPASSEAWNVIV